MHDAQCLAGMAFSNALLGIVHSMAHKVGAVFHIPHGCANAIFLPYVIQYNRKNCEDRYGDIAKMLKLEGNTNGELTDSLIKMIDDMNDKLAIPHTMKEYGIAECDFNDNLKMIDDMNDKLAIPHTMKEYGIAECDFNDNLKFISHNAVLDACTGSNPREIDDETMEKLFKCTYYGDKVRF